MLRQMILYFNIVAFLSAQIISQSGQALNQQQIEGYNEAFKITEVTKKPVKLKVLVEKLGSSLPSNLKEQFEYLVKENPDLEVPKLDVKKIKIKGEEQIQIQMNTKQGSLVWTTVQSNDTLATVVGDFNHKPVNLTIGYDFIKESPAIVYDIRNDLNSKKVHFLSVSELLVLSEQDRKNYFKEIREIMALTEKLQNETQGQEAAMNDQPFYQLFFGQNAHAKWAGADSPCIVAGYPSNYGGKTYCQMPKEAQADQKSCSSGTFKCNPLLYGDNVCLQKQGVRIPQDATERCNFNDIELKNVVSADELKKNGGRLDKLIEKMKESVNKISDACDENTFDTLLKQGKLAKDQPKTCTNLKFRIAEINKLDCAKDLEKYRSSLGDKVSNIRCSDPVPPAAPVPVVVPPPVPPEVTVINACPAESTGLTDLKPNCEEKDLFQCTVGGKVLYKCNKPQVATNPPQPQKSEDQKCGPNEVKTTKGNCIPSSSGNVDRGRGSSGLGSFLTSIKPFLPFLAIGAMMLFSWYSQRRSVDNYYKMLNASLPNAPVYYNATGTTTTTTGRVAPYPGSLKGPGVK